MWRRLSGFVVLVAIAFPLVSGPATPACACSCVAFTEAEALARAEVVFDGVVLDVAPAAAGDRRLAPRLVRFAVQRLVKGQAGEQIKVTTESSSASCGYEFEAGKRYRVHLKGGNTGLCAGNRLLGPTADPPVPAGPATAGPATTGPATAGPATTATTDAGPPAPGRTESAPAGSGPAGAGPGPSDPSPVAATSRRTDDGPSTGVVLGLVGTSSVLLGAAGLALYRVRRRRPGPAA